MRSKLPALLGQAHKAEHIPKITRKRKEAPRYRRASFDFENTKNVRLCDFGHRQKGALSPGPSRGASDFSALATAADNFGISAGPASPAPDRPSHELRLVAIRSEEGTRIRGFIMGVTDVCIFGDFHPRPLDLPFGNIRLSKILPFGFRLRNLSVPDRPSHELRLVAIRSEEGRRIRDFIMGSTDAYSVL